MIDWSDRPNTISRLISSRSSHHLRKLLNDLHLMNTGTTPTELGSVLEIAASFVSPYWDFLDEIMAELHRNGWTISRASVQLMWHGL